MLYPSASRLRLSPLFPTYRVTVAESPVEPAVFGEFAVVGV